MASLFERYLFDIDVDIAIGKTLYPFADIALAKEKSRQDVERQIVEVALAASSKILEREVSEQDSKKLVEDFVSDIKKK